MRSHLGACLACALACAACEGPADGAIDGGFAEPPSAEASPPDRHARSAILIVVDGMRLDAVDPERMPELTRLASAGVAFQSRSAAPSCAPSVASLMTSLDPERHRLDDDSYVLTAAVWTLPEALRCEGFATALFAANGYVSDRFGLAQGFQHSVNYIREERSTDIEVVTGEAARWIAERERERFFVYLHLGDLIASRVPPAPFTPPPPPGVALEDTQRWMAEARWGRRRPTAAQRRWARALYEANARYLDAMLGRFVERLDALGLDRSTLLVVTSDHGIDDAHIRLPAPRDDDPELLDVPLIFRGPAAPPPSSATVPARDVAPTILEALGLSVPARFEGRSVGPRRLAAPAGAPRLEYPSLTGTFALCEQLRSLSYFEIDCDELMRRREAERAPERALAPFAPCPDSP